MLLLGRRSETGAGWLGDAGEYCGDTGEYCAFVRLVGFIGSDLRAARTTTISYNRSFPIYVKYEKSRDNWPPSRKPRKPSIVPKENVL